MTPAQRSLLSTAKRWSAIGALIIPPLAWGSRKFDATLATKLDKNEFHASRDSLNNVHALDQQRADFQFMQLRELILRVDSTARRIERRR